MDEEKSRVCVQWIRGFGGRRKVMVGRSVPGILAVQLNWTAVGKAPSEAA